MGFYDKTIITEVLPINPDSNVVEKSLSSGHEGLGQSSKGLLKEQRLLWLEGFDGKFQKFIQSRIC